MSVRRKTTGTDFNRMVWPPSSAITPALVTGLLAWYDVSSFAGVADNAAITSWPAKGGQCGTLTGTAVKNTAAGSSYLQSVSMIGSVPCGIKANQPFTLVMVGSSNGSSSGCSGSIGASSSQLRAHHFFYVNSTYKDTQGFYYNATYVSYYYQLPVGTPTMYGAGLQPLVGGLQTAQFWTSSGNYTGISNTFNYDAGPFAIGRLYPGHTGVFYGYLRASLLYDHMLDRGEWALLQSWAFRNFGVL